LCRIVFENADAGPVGTVGRGLSGIVGESGAIVVSDFERCISLEEAEADLSAVFDVDGLSGDPWREGWKS
jgi:hypothetical protein